MFRTVLLTIIRSLFTVHSAMVYVIQVFRQFSSRIRMGLVLSWSCSVPSWFCSKAGYKPLWHTPLLSVQWINSWWWTEELSETCRVSCQNKFERLVHLVGFIIKKVVTMHGHMNVKKNFKTVSAQQGKNIHHYKNIKVDLYKANASIWELWQICVKECNFSISAFVALLCVIGTLLRLEI
jgi:hypothetical protein